MREETTTFRATDPATGESLTPDFHNASVDEIDRAMELADRVFDEYRASLPEKIAGFLDAIAEEIEQLGDAAGSSRAHRETALPIARLTSERGRTTNQARLFARMAREGSWADARIDSAMPDRQPLPRSDLRRLLMPIGPVVVFGRRAIFHWRFRWPVARHAAAGAWRWDAPWW